MQKEVIIISKIWKELGEIYMAIKRILTLKVAFNNILSKQKYKKETKIPKENISVLGITKL